MQVSVNSYSMFNVKEINNLPWRHLNLLPLRTINLFNIKSQNVLKPPASTNYYMSMKIFGILEKEEECYHSLIAT